MSAAGLAGDIGAEAPARAGIDLADVLPRWRTLAVFLVLLAAIRLGYFAAAGIYPDEGYYWLWGQNLALSYYDHPPLGGWMHGLTSALFGDGIIQARLGPVLTQGVCFALVWHWVKKLAPEPLRGRAFATAVAIWLATPMMMTFQSLALIDHVFIAAGLCAVHFFVLFAQSRAEGATDHRLLYTFAVCLGLAALTKYNAAFIGVGVALWILWQRDRMAWLRDPHLWLAAAVSLAVFAPVLIWNHQHGWPSFRFYLQDRIGFEAHSPAQHAIYFTQMTVAQVSPLLLFAIVRFVIGRGPAPEAAWLRGPAVAIFLLGLAVWYPLTLKTPVAFYWNVTSYLIPLMIAPFLFRSAMEVRVHLVYGVFYSGLLLFNQAAIPLTTLTMDVGHRTENIIFSGQPLVDALDKAKAETGADLIVTTDYLTASMVSLEGRRTDIVHVGMRRDMWDFWFDGPAHEGQSAVVLADDKFPVTETVAHVFEKVTPLGEHVVMRFGVPLHRYRLYLAEGFSGRTEAPEAWAAGAPGAGLGQADVSRR